jgi:hypothetical protein
MSTKFSQFTAQSTVSDDDYINITGAQNRRIRWPDFLDNVYDRIVTPFIYPTIESLQEAPLRADQDDPVYVRVEETEYRLYKITTIEAGPDDIVLDNGNVATAQTEYRDIGFVVGPESSTVGNLAIYDNTTGTLLADGPNPSTFGVNLIEFPDSALDGYMRKKNDNTLEIITAGQLKVALNLDQVNNTSDANKPISTATQSALDLKADTSAVDAIVLDLESQINVRVQSVATIADLRALTGVAVGQQFSVPGEVGGLFTAISGTDADDNVVTYVTANGVRVRRNDYKVIHVAYAGVTGTGTETTGIQQAINAAILYKRPLKFDGSKTYSADVLSINGDIKIDGQGCSTIGVGNGFFQQTASCDYIHITGFKNHTWSAQTGTIGKQFFWNTTAVAGSTAFADDLYYCKDFRFYGNKIGASKLEVGGSLTVPNVSNSEWVTDDTVSVAPAYLFLSRGTTDADAGPVYVEKNIFDVWGASGTNKDIVKITGGISGGQFHGNKVKNRNVASDAQVDVFTGAHKMQFAFNDLINVQLHRKQVQGALPSAPSLYAYDNYLCNTFTQDVGWVQTRSVYHIGNLAKYIGNSFVLKNTVEPCVGILFDRSDVDTGFDTDAVVATISALNIFNLSGGHVGSDAVVVSPATIGASGARWVQMANNIQIGGDKMLSGGSQRYSVIDSNIFGNASGATGTSLNGGLENSVTGNVADNAAAVFAGNSEGNVYTTSIPTLAAGATPDVTNGNEFYVNSATNITNFVGGPVGKRIVLLTGGTTTIVNSANIRLLANANYVMDAFYKSLTLIRVSPTEWRQI